MPSNDPLTLRHGAIVSQTWSMIAEARSIALAGPSMAQSSVQLRRLRYLKRKIFALHRSEMQREDASTPAIDGWFRPIEESLAKAEAYFSQRILALKTNTSLDFSHDGYPRKAVA